jgi:hypothetical protein
VVGVYRRCVRLDIAYRYIYLRKEMGDSFFGKPPQPTRLIKPVRQPMLELEQKVLNLNREVMHLKEEVARLKEVISYRGGVKQSASEYELQVKQMVQRINWLEQNKPQEASDERE